MPRTLQHEIGKRRPFDLIEEEAYLNLVRTAGVLGCQFTRLFRRHGLSEASYNVLRILRGESDGGAGPLPTQVIGERLITPVPDVTRLLDRIEQAGLVERARTSVDRRVVLISITTRGLGLLASLDAPVRELHKGQLGHLGKTELKQLIRFLEKAREAAGDSPSHRRRP